MFFIFEILLFMEVIIVEILKCVCVEKFFNYNENFI